MSKTVFTKVDYTLGALMSSIELGNLGLPDIQRPFVWKNSKVRNLFDSLYRGYPVGYLLFWENGAADENRTIGTGEKQVAPNLLIVDGQQRLTALYAVLKGKQVVRENWESEHIEISFNPLEEKFAVSDAAIRRDKSFIPNISILWDEDTLHYKFTEQFLSELRDTRELSEEEVGKIHEALDNLHNLPAYPFTALQLSPTIDDEQVSEVFVRINSEGKKLNQADFILTLMSVFWDEGRSELETFCREARKPSTGKASSFNHFIKPGPDQLLRVGIGLGFRRAKLPIVYSILRGKDLETGEFSPELRVQQFEVLKQAQARVLKLQYWHDFLKSLISTGFRSEKMISSANTVLYSYTFYLLGRTEYDVEEHKLRQIIGQWFFMASLTGRYTSSPESTLEADLARLREVKNSDEFIAVLRQICETALTTDFWAITLPNELATTSARSPSMFAYFASLNLLDARVLFSKQTVSDLMDPATHAPKKSMERHHLFPKNHLKSIGITETRDVNQIANFTLVEWGDNLGISDKPPADYMSELSERFVDKMSYWHALPPSWENMDYHEFLQARRELMAQVIADAYEKISTDGEPPVEAQAISIESLVEEGESAAIEFKSTLRINLHTGEKDPRMELAILRTIAGFINNNGGTLVVGVADDGTPVGIENDGFENEDKMCLHLANLIKGRIGLEHSLYIHPRFDDYEDARVLMVECQRGKAAVFVKDGDTERFYIRSGTATAELSASETHEYIKHRFQ